MAGHRRAAVGWTAEGPDRRVRGECADPLGGLEGVFSGALLDGLNASTNRSSPGLGCDLRPSIMGRSCDTDRGRSECRTLRQESIALRKPDRYPLLRATCDAAGM